MNREMLGTNGSSNLVSEIFGLRQEIKIYLDAEGRFPLSQKDQQVFIAGICQFITIFI